MESVTKKTMPEEAWPTDSNLPEIPSERPEEHTVHAYTTQTLQSWTTMMGPDSGQLLGPSWRTPGVPGCETLFVILIWEVGRK